MRILISSAHAFSILFTIACVPVGAIKPQRCWAMHHPRREELNPASRVCGPNVDASGNAISSLFVLKRGDSARYAAVAWRTTPTPASTIYALPFATIANDGPLASGSGRGIPVPRKTTNTPCAEVAHFLLLRESRRVATKMKFIPAIATRSKQRVQAFFFTVRASPILAKNITEVGAPLREAAQKDSPSQTAGIELTKSAKEEIPARS